MSDIASPHFLNRFFGFTGRVDQRSYVIAGISLMSLKYLVDATVIRLYSGQWWTPIDYLSPLITLKADKLEALPMWIAVGMMLWTMPFLWIAISMSLRRAIDAGKSPTASLFVLVPIVNYAVMLWLASLPSSPKPGVFGSDTITSAGRVRSALIAAVVSITIGVGAIALLTMELRNYGLSVFLATPFAIGGIAAFIHNYRHTRTWGETQGVVMMTLVILGLVIILFALEGAVCLAMAFPIATVAALLGGGVGRALARHSATPPAFAAHILLLIPAVGAVDNASNRVGYEAVTSIVINAPPEVVWNKVVSFSDIAGDPGFPFNLGIAYPVRATISGTGVGAVRHCEFSTGAFVEPITVWDSPRRLGFDVASQPPPLREWSPYREVYTPHLKGFFQSKRGEFRLIGLPGGRTRLEGSTWYEMEMYPQPYWRPIAEWLLHRIHGRVLEQVRLESESRVAARNYL